LSEATPGRPFPSGRIDDISRPAIPNRRPRIAGRRRAEPGRHHAPVRRRAGRARARPTRAMDRRPPSGTIVAESSPGGTEIACMQTILLDPLTPNYFSPRCVHLSGCIRFAISEMHLCLCPSQFASQAVIVLGFKTFRKKSNLRVRSPSRDGMRAIVPPWAGPKTGQKSAEMGPFRRFFARLRAGFSGRHPTSGPSETVCCLRHRDATVSKSRRALNPLGFWA
jgi:hypothetical protein